MTGTTFGRRTLVTMGLALLVGIGMVGSVDATRLDKAAFKQGCQAGGGSFVDNPDGSFQCNVSGGTVKCFADDTCVFISSSAVLDEGGTGGQPSVVGPLDGSVWEMDGVTGFPTSGVTQPVVSQPVISQPVDDQDQDQDNGKKNKKHKKGKKGGKGRR
jgi:hypothetical protein